MKHTVSDSFYQEASTYIPGGVNSPVRAFASVHANPIFIDHALGSHVYDVDGNSYLDMIGSWGPMILGHAHPLLTKDMQAVIDKGISYGLCTPKEVELAKLICEAYDGVDMVRMVNSGTEATMSAIRVARGYTGKNKIIKFEGCYHGHSDGLLVKAGSGALTFGVPTSPGVPATVTQNTIVCTYNDLQSVKQAIDANKHEIACIIIEPIAANMGVVLASDCFLRGLRDICDEENILLIFDEVISGFRVAYGGAAEYYGITPDMACFGKIIGAGLPVGAYGGRSDIMKTVSPCGNVYQAGTLSGNPLAMYLGSKLLTHLKTHPYIYEELEQKGRFLKNGIEQLLQEKALPYTVHQIGSLLTVFFSDSPTPIMNYQDVLRMQTKPFEAYFHALFDQGVLIAPSPYEAMFVSMAHTQADLEQLLQAIARAL